MKGPARRRPVLCGCRSLILVSPNGTAESRAVIRDLIKTDPIVNAVDNLSILQIFRVKRFTPASRARKRSAHRRCCIVPLRNGQSYLVGISEI